MHKTQKVPNVAPKIIEVDHLPHLCFTASKDICVGDQLEYDYGDRSKSSVKHNSWLAK